MLIFKMKKFLSYIFIITFLFGTFFIPGIQVSASQEEPNELCRYQTVDGVRKAINEPCKSLFLENGEVNPSVTNNTSTFWASLMKAVLWIPGAASIGVMKIASLLTYLSGIILNYIIQLTVVNMKGTLFASGGAIDEAWKVIRDVANMGFIFVLLYAAIKTIVGQGGETQKLIKNIVIVAILINFSLFFTKVAIDVSNVVAMTFYDAIAPGSLNSTEWGETGIANSLMDSLNLQSIWRGGALGEGDKLLVIGVMGTILCLIAAFVFFAIALMFIIRFVVLIFVLILSPLAFISMILPGDQANKVSKQWSEALLGQAVFAPAYFLLTWIVIKISRKLIPTDGGDILGALQNTAAAGTTTSNPDSIGILVNFFIVIAMLIFSLVTAKEISSKSGAMVGKATSWATGAAGGMAFGGLGWAGRTSFGRAGRMAAENAALQTAAKEKTGSAGAGARLALYASKKARSGTFDARNATIPTNAVGDLIEGTAGRTWVGKKMGLDEVKIPSIQAGAFAAATAGVGAGGTEGFKESQEAKAKRIEAREKVSDEELRKVKAQAVIKTGTATGAGAIQIQEMEKVMAKMSDKEVEAIVDSNREILKSQQFANALSVKQLEALNKSDKLSEAEKDTLKDNRFKAINTALAGAGPIPATLLPEIKALTDAELEMINPTHLNDVRFVGQLRGSQIEAINKSNKFTRTQKNQLRDKRREPLTNALTAGAAPVAQNELRKFSPKEITALGMGIMTNPLLLPAYTPNMLKRMATEMNTADIQTLRALLIAHFPIGSETGDWLRDANTGVVDFS